MENWGLITYRTTAVLFDEYASDQKYRNRTYKPLSLTETYANAWTSLHQVLSTS
jgi:aminopeptidase N